MYNIEDKLYCLKEVISASDKILANSGDILSIVYKKKYNDWIKLECVITGSEIYTTENRIVEHFETINDRRKRVIEDVVLL